SLPGEFGVDHQLDRGAEHRAHAEFLRIEPAPGLDAKARMAHEALAGADQDDLETPGPALAQQGEVAVDPAMAGVDPVEGGGDEGGLRKGRRVEELVAGKL